MNLIKNKRIAIVGGGPGGLTLTRLLQMEGAQVKVYERDVNRNVRVQGATLDLHHDSGLKALERAGLMEAFKANYRPGADRMSVTDKNANVLFKEEFSGDGAMFRPEIDRGPLRNILLDSLQSDTIVWDSQFVNLEHIGKEIKLNFKNGTSAYADLVIAADGANSKIRPYITPIQPFYSGVTAIEATVYDAEQACPEVYQLLNGGKIFALGDEKTLIISSKGDGSLQFYPGFKAEENWVAKSGIDFSNKRDVINWFKKEFSDWSTIWNTLLEQAALPFTPRPLFCMPFDQTWETLPNITMLGDAAHLMPPYAGEGVNMAMLDALELAECLLDDKYQNISEALNSYENQMRARASATSQITMDQTKILHSAEGLTYLLEMFKG